ncbi:hypothetical protein A2U01_0076076, partial [Trifolium medium]|nr:hypothetical protein [Trifolium medium]
MKLSLIRRFLLRHWWRTLAGKMNRFHRSFLGNQERSLSASKISHLLHRSRSRYSSAVVEVREAALTAEEAEAPAIQVSETPNFR